MKLLKYTLTGLSLLSTLSAQTFIEQNGLVVMEAESINTPAPWAKRTAANIPAGDPEKLNGFAGSGFIEWTGTQYFGLTTTNPDTPIRYNFQINNPGTYKLVWRTKQKDAGQANDAGNDAFVRFATGTIPQGGRNFGIFTKIYVQEKAVWQVSSNAEPGGNPKFVFNNFSRVLNAGNHAVEISGRSPGHVIDRLILYRTDVPFNANQFATLPESATTGGGGGSPGAGITGSPTPIDNNPPVVNFDKTKDLFVAQFDSKPDPDDIQAIAAVGCMLAHPDLHNIDFYGVQGTVGLQGWNQFNGNNNKFIEATNLMNLAFGQGRWTQAGNGLRNSFPNNSNYSDYSPANTNWTASVTRVRDKAKAAIDRGGKVYVMEAGNSDFTHDWVQALQAMGVSSASTKQNVVVVQHSNWNENQTTTTNRVGAAGNETIPGNRTVVLNWVRDNTDYRRIADGNGNNATPGYNTNQTQWALNAEAASNPNSHARALWIAAENAMNTVFSRNPSTYPSYSNIRFRGAVDFSDTCEAWYIFNRGTTADNISKFWNRYVTNTNSASGPVPRDFGGGGPGNGGTNTLDCASLPGNVVNDATINIALGYTASASRDIYLEVRRVSDNAWIQAQTLTVPAGTDTTANFTLNIGTQAPGEYKFTAGMYNVGENWTNGPALDNCSSIPFTLGTALTNTVDCSSIPSEAADGASIQFSGIGYTAAGNRDIVLELWNATTNTWINAQKQVVTAGSSTVDFSISVEGKAAYTGPGNNYLVKVSTRPPGGAWNDPDTTYCPNAPLTITGTGGGTPANDSLLCNTLPGSLTNATTLNVGLGYEATVSRDIYLEIRRVSDNAWIQAQTLTVAAGADTANFTLNIGTQPAGTYKFTAGMYPVGQNWTNGPALDNCSSIQFNLVSPAPQTVNIVPAADVYFQNTTKVNGNNLRAEGNFRTSYLRFNVSGVTGANVTGAKLRLVLPAQASGGDNGTGTLSVYKGSGNGAWTEASITSTNVPSQGALLGSKNATFGYDTTHEIDLTAAEIPKSGNVTLILKFSPGDVAFSSKEGVTDPQLVITSQ